MSKTKYKGNYMGLFAMLLITLLVIGLGIYLMPTVHAAEEDVTTWTASGTCEWGIDPDGCLWIRPTDGVSGTLADWGTSYAPWYGATASVKSVVVKPGVSAVTCRMMFGGLKNCTSIDLAGLDTSNVTSMYQMFAGCSGLTSLDLSGFDTGNATDMGNMFADCSGLTSLDVSGFDTSKVTNMKQMFYYCSALTSLDLSGFDTGNVTSMYQMFYNCSGLTSLDVSGFDTSKVTNMGGMFNCCHSLTSLDVSGFDTGNVTDMQQMFDNCSKLTSLDASRFNTSNVTNMGSMFNCCHSLTSLDVSGFDTGNVTDMQQMFNGCYSLTSLDVSGFDTGNVTNMRNMFYNCSKLTSLDVSSFDTSNVTRMDSMFANCVSLNTVKLGETFKFNGKDITATYGKAILPIPPSTSTTGKWIKDDGSVGPLTAKDLQDQYQDNAQSWSGTWVWETIPTTYTVIFDNGNGETSRQKYAPDEDATIPNEIPQSAGQTFVSWNTAGDGSGIEYTPGDVIPANTFAVGETITLYAQWEIMDPNLSEFNATLLLDKSASVPNATIAFTAAPGTGIAAVPGTSLAVLAPTVENGVTGVPTLGTATFAAGDATVTSVDGVTIGANQKAVVKPVSIDFNGVTFAQPGIFRYLITEPSEGSGLTYDTQLSDSTNSVRYQRVLDVYVIRDANDDYVIGGYVFHEVANAPAVGVDTAADKSTGFVHEYDTKSITLESRVTGNQSSIDKYFAYTITMQNPNNGIFTVTADWTDAADALHPTANPATKYDTDVITAANTAEWTSNTDGSMSKTIYLRNGQKIAIDGIPAGATYAVSVAEEDYGPSWTAGDGSGSTNATGNRVLNAIEDVVFTLTRDGVVPTGVMLSAVPGLIIMAGALVVIIAMRKRKEDQAEA